MAKRAGCTWRWAHGIALLPHAWSCWDFPNQSQGLQGGGGSGGGICSCEVRSTRTRCDDPSLASLGNRAAGDGKGDAASAASPPSPTAATERKCPNRTRCRRGPWLPEGASSSGAPICGGCPTARFCVKRSACSTAENTCARGMSVRCGKQDIRVSRLGIVFDTSGRSVRSTFSNTRLETSF